MSRDTGNSGRSGGGGGGSQGTWVLIFEGRLYSNENGTAREEVFAVEGFGLQVSQMIVAVVVLSRSSTTAQISAAYDEGATGDASPMRSGGTLIAGTAPSTVPTTLRGQTTTAPLPYVRLRASLSDTANVLGWMDVSVYAGGRVP